MNFPFQFIVRYVKCNRLSSTAEVGQENVYSAWQGGPNQTRTETFTIKPGQKVTKEWVLWQAAIADDGGEMIFGYSLCSDRNAANDPHMGDVQLRASRTGDKVTARWNPAGSSSANMSAANTFVLDGNSGSYEVELIIVANGQEIPIPPLP